MTRITFRVLFFASLAMALYSFSVSAQTEASRSGASLTGDDMLQVTISASTQHIIRGAIYGLDADLKNASSRTLLLELNTITLAVQPELAPNKQRCVYYYAPSMNPFYYQPSANPAQAAGPQLILQPGEHVPIFFNLGIIPPTPPATDAAQKAAADQYMKACGTSGFWSGVRKVLDFTPGNYSFVLSGKVRPFLTTYDAKGQADGGQWAPLDNVFSQSAQLPVGIDQSQILLCAAIGGLLAYIVMALRGRGDMNKLAAISTDARWDRVRQVGVIVKNGGAAAFLSAAVTIVASRLSETDFPVKVSVNDFWGALTIGFVAYFIGGKFIDKLAGLREDSNDDQKKSAASSSDAALPPTHGEAQQ